jgi:hypothetical protein
MARPVERDDGDDTAELPAAATPAAAAKSDLARDVAELWLRVERIERELGLAEDLNAPTPSRFSSSE